MIENQKRVRPNDKKLILYLYYPAEIKSHPLQSEYVKESTPELLKRYV